MVWLLGFMFFGSVQAFRFSVWVLGLGFGSFGFRAFQLRLEGFRAFGVGDFRVGLGLSIRQT